MAVMRPEKPVMPKKKAESVREDVRTKITAREAVEKPSAEKRLALMRLRKERIEQMKAEGR